MRSLPFAVELTKEIIIIKKIFDRSYWKIDCQSPTGTIICNRLELSSSRAHGPTSGCSTVQYSTVSGQGVLWHVMSHWLHHVISSSSSSSSHIAAATATAQIGIV